MSIASLTNTNISDTYQGVLHAGGIPLASAGVQDIFDGYGNTSSLKLGRACNGASICGTLSADSIKIADPTILFNQLINLIYPINSIYLSLNTTAPFPGSGTTWVRSSSGQFIVSVGSSTDSNNYTKTFAASDNTGKFSMLSGDLPQHFHFISNTTSDHGSDKDPLTPSNYLQQGGRIFTSTYAYELEGNAVLPTVGRTSTVGTTIADITPPSYGVYVWRRTA